MGDRLGLACDVSPRAEARLGGFTQCAARVASGARQRTVWRAAAVWVGTLTRIGRLFRARRAPALCDPGAGACAACLERQAAAVALIRCHGAGGRARGRLQGRRRLGRAGGAWRAGRLAGVGNEGSGVPPTAFTYTRAQAYAHGGMQRARPVRGEAGMALDGLGMAMGWCGRAREGPDEVMASG